MDMRIGITAITFMILLAILSNDKELPKLSMPNFKPRLQTNIQYDTTKDMPKSFELLREVASSYEGKKLNLFDAQSFFMTLKSVYYDVGNIEEYIDSYYPINTRELCLAMDKVYVLYFLNKIVGPLEIKLVRGYYSFDTSTPLPHDLLFTKSMQLSKLEAIAVMEHRLKSAYYLRDVAAGVEGLQYWNCYEFHKSLVSMEE